MAKGKQKEGQKVWGLCGLAEGSEARPEFGFWLCPPRVL